MSDEPTREEIEKVDRLINGTDAAGASYVGPSVEEWAGLLRAHAIEAVKKWDEERDQLKAENQTAWNTCELADERARKAEAEAALRDTETDSLKRLHEIGKTAVRQNAALRMALAQRNAIIDGHVKRVEELEALLSEERKTHERIEYARAGLHEQARREGAAKSAAREEKPKEAVIGHAFEPCGNRHGWSGCSSGLGVDHCHFQACGKPEADHVAQ